MENKNLLDRMSEKFNSFYDDIDTQMNHLRNSDSFLSQLAQQSDDAKLLDKMRDGQISDHDIDELVKSAKEFEREVKNYVKENRLKEKIAQKQQKPKVMLVKSQVPPIWNDDKLNLYIESILNEMIQVEEPAQKSENLPEVPSIKPILRKAEKPSKILKRNVGTNVKFQIHKANVKIQENNRKPPIKKVCRTTQTFTNNHPHMELEPSSGTIFPRRVERKTNENGSADLKLKSGMNVPFLRPQTAPAGLKYSPITVTSTMGDSKISEEHIVNVINGNLATKPTKNTKQMSVNVFPVISIKGSCRIQKIYQHEILPLQKLSHQNETRFDFTSNDNNKFVEFCYQPPPKKPIENYKELKPSEISDVPSKISVVTVERAQEAQNTSLIDTRDLSKILNDFGVHLRDGKIHVVVQDERKPVAKRIVKKVMKTRRSPKILFFKKPLSGVDVNQVIETESNAIGVTANQELENVPSENSSLTDDGKIRQILLNVKTLDKKSSSSSSESNHETSDVVIYESEPEKPIDIKRSVTENFQSIYKMIEETFQSNEKVNTQPNDVNDKALAKGVNDMKTIIKQSEDNIKRAGILLEKYRVPSIDVALQVPSTPQISTESKVNEEIQTEEPEMELCQSYEKFTDGLKTTVEHQKLNTVDFCGQTIDEKNVQTDGNLNWKSQLYFGSVFEKYSNFEHVKFHQPLEPRHNPFNSAVNPCSCIGCETRRILPKRSISFQQPESGNAQTFSKSSSSSIVTPIKLSAPYNPIYSDNDEIMRAANKFLRSIEKRKNRDGEISSSEMSSSPLAVTQNVIQSKSSSSISTPSSDLRNNEIENDLIYGSNYMPRGAPISRINLADKLQKASEDIEQIEKVMENIGIEEGN